MAEVRSALCRVSSRGTECAKPDCRQRTLHRHHIRHEAMFLGVWGRRRATEEKWQQFVARYYEFRVEDCVTLCSGHHAEIHQYYDKIITGFCNSFDLKLSKMSWAQAETLMKLLEDCCMKWLDERTPGIDSKAFAKRRAKARRRRRK